MSFQNLYPVIGICVPATNLSSENSVSYTPTKGWPALGNLHPTKSWIPFAWFPGGPCL